MIAVRGMTMPKNCGQCALLCDYGDKCEATLKDLIEILDQVDDIHDTGTEYEDINLRPEWCPLIEIAD